MATKTAKEPTVWVLGLTGLWGKYCEACGTLNVAEKPSKQPPAAFACKACDARRVAREERARQRASTRWDRRS